MPQPEGATTAPTIDPDDRLANRGGACCNSRRQQSGAQSVPTVVQLSRCNGQQLASGQQPAASAACHGLSPRIVATETVVICCPRTGRHGLHTQCNIQGNIQGNLRTGCANCRCRQLALTVSGTLGATVLPQSVTVDGLSDRLSDRLSHRPPHRPPHRPLTDCCTDRGVLRFR